MMKKILWGLNLLVLVGCGSSETTTPLATEAAVADASTATTVATVAATWTAVPVAIVNTLPAPPTMAAPATVTPVPTVTAVPATDTPTVLPTETVPPATETFTPAPATATAVPATAAATAIPATPTTPANPVLGQNILPNSSFEEGWYNRDGRPDLHVPNGWTLEWDEGPTGFGNQPWDIYVRPKSQVMPSAALPEAERATYIWEGNQTYKLYKDDGAFSVRLFRDITLDPGTYVLAANAFADMVQGYNGRDKIWAGDPNSGEVRLFAGNASSDWMASPPGQKTPFSYTFTITSQQSVRIGVALRGRYALSNTGWFVDDWSLKQLQ